MYGVESSVLGIGVTGLAVAPTTLAATGFAAFPLTVLAVILIITGLLLTRRGAIERARREATTQQRSG